MKDSYFFSHDYNARHDPKMQEILMDYGVAGIGIFWCIIEQLYEQGGSLPLSSIKAIAFTLHANIDDVRNIIGNYGLFDNDGTDFWSPSVNRRLESRKLTTEKRAKAASKRWQSDANAMQIHNDDDANAMQDNNSSNAMQCYKKKRKEKEIKEKDNNKNNLSLTPSLGDESSERERFLEIFFFKNFKRPAAEVERFVSHYAANGWRRRGQDSPVENRIELAKCWEPKEEAQRFQLDVLANWKALYNAARERNPGKATLLLSELYAIEVNANNIRIKASKELKELMYANANFFNNEFFYKFYPDKTILWG